jgi:hypothetical protein
VVRRAIPKKAVKPLIEHCNRFAAKLDRSGAELFRDYLTWMKKYAGYVFADPWPPKLLPKTDFWLSEEEVEFVEAGSTYEEEVERFAVMLLKRSISLESFSAENFESEFDFYGRMFCHGCCVPEAMHLRWYTVRLAETNGEFEEQLRRNPADDFYRGIVESRTSPEAVRSEKIAHVKLMFLEEDAGTEGKACEARNKFLCPYGSGAQELIKLGHNIEFLWRLLEFYDSHWNRNANSCVPPGWEKHYHFDEQGFIDLTSREDILASLEDARIDRVAEEFVDYNREKASRQQ